MLKILVIMVLCAAPNCDTKYGEGLNLFFFPSDYHLCKIWEKKLKTDAKYWPSKHSKLCERHFTPDCFLPMEPEKARSLGFSRITLKKNSIPTIFDYTPLNVKILKRKNESPALVFGPAKLRKSGKVEEKRDVIRAKRRLELLQEKENVYIMHMPSHTPNVTEPLPGLADENQIEQTSEDVDLNATLPYESPEESTFEIGTQTTYSLVRRRHAEVQACLRLPASAESKPSTTTVATQTKENKDVPCCCSQNLDASFTSAVSDETETSQSVPSEWAPSDSITPTEDFNIHDHLEPQDSDHTDRKFIVFEKCLDSLLSYCNVCGRLCTIDKRTVGTYLSVSRHCSCGELFQWGSQPMSGTLPLGNLVVRGAILFSGASIMQSLNLFHHANITCFSERTFHNIQQLYLVPAVERVWKSQQDALLARIKEEGRDLHVGGDARCCSPGHTAKYGSYSLMDLETNQTLDIQLIQSNEVKSSYWMELEGLKRCLQKLDGEGISISNLVTDRHSQVKAYIRNEREEINHWFDVWHVAKGIYKKLDAVGKRKKCKLVGEWARSVSNHLYWCAASSQGVGKLVLEKWLSVLNHIADVHEDHGSLFTRCQHGPLADRAWIKKGSLPYMELEKVIKGRLLVKDIEKLSPTEQTSSLEAFHKVVCHFAPKFLHFFHIQMRARLYIAALHFNENRVRKQAVNRKGEGIFAVSYPKARCGSGVPKEVKVKQTFNYVTELMEEVLVQRNSCASYRQARNEQRIATKDVPRPIAHAYSENKEKVIENHRSRFQQTCT